MPETKAPRVTAAAEAASDRNSLGNALAQSAESWLAAQAELLASIETLSQDWLRRRREDIDAARDTVQRLSECREPSDIFRVQQDWLAGAIKRAQSDISAVNNGIASMTRAATSEFEATLRAATQSIRAAEGEMFRAAAGNKPSPRK